MYQVPQHIDKNKIFIVQRSEIEGRLDPKMALYNRKNQSSLYPKVRLKDLIVCKPQYGSGEPGIERKNVSDARYIRITDIDENGLISQDDLGATANYIEDKYILNENDILIARSGNTVGKAYIHKSAPYDCFFAGYLIRFIIDKQKALPEYIFTFTQLKTYKDWVKAVQRPSGQPNINSEEYQSLEIPLPDIDKQQEIVDIINSAYLQKRQKESEAQLLLDSIDAYILNELGITIPEIKTDLKNRIFKVNRSDLEDRLDPKFNKNYSFIKSLKGIYTWVTLRDVTFNNGQYGANESAVEYKKGDVRYIRITDIDEYGNLKQTDKKTASNIDNAYLLKPNDILFARSGSVGRCYIHKFLEEQAIFAGYLIRFFLNENLIDADYLFYYCNSNIYKYWVDTIQRPAVQANINAQEYRSMPIPLPPIVKQKEIANHIYAIRQQAKQLQEEDKTILENAKKEVEQMILG